MSSDDFYGRATLAFEVAVLCILAQRLRDADEDSTPADAARWTALDMAVVYRMLKTLRGGLGEQAAVDVAKAAEQADRRAAKFYRMKGLDPVKTSGNTILTGLLKYGKSRVNGSILDCLRTSVFMLYDNQGNLVPFKKGYLGLCQEVIAKIPVMGTQEAIADVVNRFARQGIKVMYPSGQARELWSAVEMNVRDALHKCSNDFNQAHGEMFGADGVEITAHMMCAPDHLPYQGREYTKAKFEQIQGGLERPIGEGYNCKHDVLPCILGAGTTYDAQRLREFRDAATRPTGFKLKSGRELTAYEFTQWQRAQENDVRRIKGAMSILRSGGQPTDRLQAQLDRKIAQYEQASRKAGIRTRYDRMAAYTFKIKEQ